MAKCSGYWPIGGDTIKAGLPVMQHCHSCGEKEEALHMELTGSFFSGRVICGSNIMELPVYLNPTN